MGVAILMKPAVGSIPEGVVLKPLSDPLWFDTCVVMRANDDSKLVNDKGPSRQRVCLAEFNDLMVHFT